MKYILIFLGIILGIAFSVINPNLFSIGYARPDLVLLIISVVSLTMGTKRVLIIAFTAGLITDPYIGSILGYHALLYTIIAYGIIKVREYMYKENIVFHIIIIFSATFIFRLVFFVTQSPHLQYAYSIPGLILSPLMTSLLYILFYYLTRYSEKVLRHVRK